MNIHGPDLARGTSREKAQQANKHAVRYFVRGDAVADVVETDSTPQVRILTPAMLKGHLERLANYVNECTDENGDPQYSLARAPSDVVKDLLTLANLELPPLRGIVTSPVFVKGGRLLDSDGYDTDSGLLVQLQGLGPLPQFAVHEAK